MRLRGKLDDWRAAIAQQPDSGPIAQVDAFIEISEVVLFDERARHPHKAALAVLQTNRYGECRRSVNETLQRLAHHDRLSGRFPQILEVLTIGNIRTRTRWWHRRGNTVAVLVSDRHLANLRQAVDLTPQESGFLRRRFHLVARVSLPYRCAPQDKLHLLQRAGRLFGKRAREAGHFTVIVCEGQAARPPAIPAGRHTYQQYD